MAHVMQRIRDASDLVARAGPCLLLEILLPGGTLFALLLYAYRRRRARHAMAPATPARRVDWLDGLLGRRIAAGGTAQVRDVLEPPEFAIAESQPQAA